METITVSSRGIELADQIIERDADQWLEWFVSAPEGTKIKFEWLNGYDRYHNFTAYRRKRYWEAQKRVSGKLRNSTIKPLDCTYLALLELGNKLTAYNWAGKFEPSELPDSYQTTSNQSNLPDSYQTAVKSTSQAQEEMTKLKAELERITQDRDNLLIKLGNEKIQASEDAQQPSALELLNQFLDEHPKIAEHLTDTRRYRAGEDLAKFGAWLRADRAH